MVDADGSVVIDTGLSTEGFDRGSKELLAAIKELSAAVTALGQKISASFSNVTASFGGVARGGTNAAKEVGALEKEIDKFVGKTTALGDKTGTAFKSADDVLKFNSNIQAAEAELDRLKEKFDEADAAPKISPEAAALTAELQKAEAELDAMKAKLQGFYAMGYTDKHIQIANPDLMGNIDAQIARVAELRKQVDQAQEAGAARMAEPFDAMAEKLSRAEEQIALAKQGIDQEALAQAQLNVQVAQEAVLQADNERARQAAIAQLEQAQTELRATAEDMSGKVAPAAEEASKSVEKIGHASRSAHKQANILVKALTSIKRMLLTRVKRMFISAIFNSIKEGIKGLALFSPAFDQALSDMKNRAKELAYNITAAIGPVLQAVMPVIARIAEAASKAMTYINAFISKLSGKSTMIVAKKQTSSYAASLREATAEAKALNEQVYGFDELNKRSSNSSGSGAGSSGGAGGLGDIFEEVEIDSAVPSKILDYINELKDAITRGDWLHFGETLADGLNAFYDRIGKIDLSPITRGINNAIDVAKGFTSKLDWAGIGRNVGQFFNNVITQIGEINWAGVGQTISNAVVGGLSSLNNFLETVDWANIGETLFQAASDLITNIDWASLVGQLGRLITNLVSSAIQLLIGSLSGLSGMLGDIFSALGMDGIAGFFYGIEEKLKNVGTWIKEHVFDPIVNWFKSLFGIHSPSTVFQGFGADLIAGLLNGISGAWKSITSFFSSALTGLKNLIGAAWSEIKNAASTAWSGIKSTLSTTWGAIKDTASNTWNNIKTGASNAWTGIKNTASATWTGIKTTLSNTWSNLKTTASSTWDNIKSKASTAWSSISSTATSKWQGVKKALSNTWSNLKTTASSTWDNIKSKASSAWDSIKSTASTKWQTIKSTVSEKWSGLKSTLSSTSWTDVGSNLVSGLRNGISNTWSTITSTATSLASSLTGSLKRLFGIASPSKVWQNTIGANLTAGLNKGIELGGKDVLSTTDKLAEQINGSMAGVSLWRGASAIAARGYSVPQIAAGTIIPAKTRISSLNSSDAIYGANKALLGGMDEQLDDQTYVLRQILTVIKKLNLTIDVGSLTRAVTKQQRAHELNYGGM